MAQLALVLPALTDCRWWFESLLVHSGVPSATRRKATGADRKKNEYLFTCPSSEKEQVPEGVSTSRRKTEVARCLVPPHCGERPSGDDSAITRS